MQDQSSLGNMAYLISMSSVWSDVLQHLYRRKQRVSSNDPSAYEDFYEERLRQVQTLANRLPRQLFPCSMKNIEQALQGGYIGTLVLIHDLYHTTLMRLNRHAGHDELEEDSLIRNMRAARYHARELLQVAHILLEPSHECGSLNEARILSMPFHGFSILSAVDVLTSIGTLADLKPDLQLVQSSLQVIQRLSRYWASAQTQLEMIAARFGAIMNALKCVPGDKTLFVTTEPIEDTFGKDLDLLFSPPLEVRFRALGISIVAGDVKGILIIKNSDAAVRATAIGNEPMIVD